MFRQMKDAIIDIGDTLFPDMDDKEWMKETIKEWIFGILVGLGFFGLYVVACLTDGGVI